MMVVISILMRHRVLELSRSGISGRKIAQQLCISHGAVQKLINKCKFGFPIENKSKSGRPRKLSARMCKKLIISSRRCPMKTARQLMVDEGLSGIASVDTIKRELRRGGLFGRIAVKKPLLTPRQIRKRKHWCSERRAWTNCKWKSVIYSDECKLELHPNTRQYVRRCKGSRIQPNCISQTRKFSKSLMVWGAIRGDGTRTLIRCDGNVDSFEYQRLLNLALPTIYTSRNLFQHDGASCHRSRSTTNFLAQKRIRVLPDWPPQSPDLNVIENLWVDLKERIKNKKPNSLEELWDIAKREWANIPNEDIAKLYDSIPRRLRAVLQNKGGHTDY